MKKITLLFSLISFMVSAQKNYQKGYIVSINKDTVRGMIDFQEWQRSPTSINFKDDVYHIESIVSPQNITSFTVEGVETFISKTFEVEKLRRDFTRTTFESLSEYAKRNKELTTKSAFLRLISDGKAKLFIFIDNDDEEHFLLGKGSETIPLIFHIAAINGSTINLNQFRNQLNSMFSDACKPLQIEEAVYKTTSLKKVCDSYNKCFGTTKINIRDEDKGHFQFGLLAGLSISTSPYISQPNVAENAPWFYLPFGGLFLNYVFARRRGKLALQNEIQNYNFQSKYEIIGTTYNTQYTFSKTFIGVNSLVKYSISIEKPSIHLLAGISNLFQLSDNSYIQYVGFGNGEKRDYVNVEPKHKLGLIIGLGSTWNKFGVEARYSLITALTTFDNLSGLKKEIGLVGRYYFKR